MTHEEYKIFDTFTECPLSPLGGVPTYEYMTNLNVYLNLCSSAVYFTLGCGTLVYLVIMAQTVVFSTNCGTPFLQPINPGIHPVRPDPVPTAAILAELVKNHKHKVRLFNKYNAVYRACKRVISQLIPEKFYN